MRPLATGRGERRPSGDFRELLNGAKTGGFRAGIALDLCLTRLPSASPQQANCRLVPRRRGKFWTLTRSFASFITEETFYNPVLTGVVREHGTPTLWGEKVKSLLNGVLEDVEFLVDLDA